MFYNDLCESYLPLNRKELFYTGTVLPMIVCKDNFKYFNIFCNLIQGNTDSPDIKVDGDLANIQFFTEYCFFDSAYYAPRFKEEIKKIGRDTPDIIVLINDKKDKNSKNKIILYAIEAKMYDKPSKDEIIEQMESQKIVLEFIGEKLNIEQKNIWHKALVPKKLLSNFRSNNDNFKSNCITWDDILDKYINLFPNDYFVNVLKYALNKYDHMVSESTNNSEGKREGLKIYENGMEDGIKRVGRGGGESGSYFQSDIASGRWKNYLYEYSTETGEMPNRNWFSLIRFIELIDKASKKS